MVMDEYIDHFMTVFLYKLGLQDCYVTASTINSTS